MSNQARGPPSPVIQATGAEPCNSRRPRTAESFNSRKPKDALRGVAGLLRWWGLGWWNYT